MTLRALLRPVCRVRGHRASGWVGNASYDSNRYLMMANERCARCGAHVRVRTLIEPNATGDMALVTREVVGPAAAGWFE